MKMYFKIALISLFSLALFGGIYLVSKEVLSNNDEEIPTPDTEGDAVEIIDELDTISEDPGEYALEGFEEVVFDKGVVVSRFVYENADTWQSYNIYITMSDQDVVSFAQTTQQSMFGDFVSALESPNAVVGGSDAVMMQYCELEPNYHYTFVEGEGQNAFVFTQGMDHDEVLSVLERFGGDSETSIPELGYIYSDPWCLENQTEDDEADDEEDEEEVDLLAICDYSETAQNTCCSEFSENEVEYFQCSSNGYGDYGNCTWWVAYQRPDVGLAAQNHPGHGSACHFDYWSSAGGLLVDDCARVGDIFVYDVEGCPGHVAYVEEVIDTSEILVSEMNWCSTCMRERTFLQQGRKYIHTADPELVFYPNPPNAITELYGSAGSCSGEEFFATQIIGSGELTDQMSKIVSAIHVPVGYSVVVSDESELAGEKVCISSDIENLNTLNYPSGAFLDGNITSYEFREGGCE
jgi:surface antigen